MAGNGIQLGFPFERTTPSPIDFFSKVADLTARDAIPSGIRFQGLTTFVVSDQKTYQLKAGIANSDWVEYGSGGGGGSMYADTFTATASQTAFTLTETPAAKQSIICAIDGVYQNLASFSLAGKVVTLDEAQPLGAIVEIRYNVATTFTDVMKLKVPRFTEITYGTDGSSGNFIPQASTKMLYFEMCGGGAPGTGSARASVNDMGFGSTNGNQTAFGNSYVNGGSRGQFRTSRPPTGGAGGAGGAFGSEVSLINRWIMNGEDGEHATDGQFARGGRGGGTFLFGCQAGRGGPSETAGAAGQYGTGGGGGGGTGEGGSQGFSGAGGGGGGSMGGYIFSPAASIAWSLGAGLGTGGTAGTAGYAGANANRGVIRIWEYE